MPQQFKKALVEKASGRVIQLNPTRRPKTEIVDGERIALQEVITLTDEHNELIKSALTSSFIYNAGTLTAAAPVASVPESITRRQMLRQLESQGDLADVESIVAGQPAAIVIDWQEASEFRRDDPALQGMISVLFSQDEKWTSGYVDQTFINAKKIR